MVNKVTLAAVDLNEIVFANKNREYGAYVLRNLYPKHLSWAMWIAIIVFTLGTTAPIIIRMLTPQMTAEELKSIQTTSKLSAVKQEKKEKKVVIEEMKKEPVKATTAFLPPVVKADELVKDTALIPTQDELKNKQVGKVTQKGDTTGGDFEFKYEEKKEAPKVVEEKKEEPTKVFTFVEEMPSFPGGTGEMMSFFAKHIQYPEIAKRAGVEGRIFVQFTVSSNGAISDPAIIKGIGAGCDEEAARVVMTMPKWNPGKQNGNSVNVRVSIPIVFKLN